MFFAVAFPVLLVAIVPAVNGGGDVLMSSGQPLGTFYAGTMAVYGAAVTAYVNMPQGVAEDRDRGVLKRAGGTPLPAYALVVGRVVGALVVALLTGVAIVVLAVGQTCLLVLAHPALERLVALRPVRVVVATVGSRLMTIYLCHLPVLALVIGLLLLTPLPAPPAGSPASSPHTCGPRSS